MYGFKKTGVYPINPSEVMDRQIAPSKPFQQPSTESSQDGSASNNPTKDPLFSPDKVELYKKRYEEGYDLDDPSYTAWLRITITQLKFVVTPQSRHLHWSLVSY